MRSEEIVWHLRPNLNTTYGTVHPTYKRLHLLPTAYVVRREGNVLTRVCPSFRLSTPRGVPWPGPGRKGGTPARSSWVPHLGYSPSDLAGGTPARGYPTSGTPHLTWLGGTPAGGYSTLGTPHQTWPGVPLQGRGYPIPGTPHQTWLGGYPCQGCT